MNSPKMRTEIPASIITPDTVDTSLGTLRFFDGLPDAGTVRKVYDNLDLMRGVDVFLNTMSAASALANIEGLKSVGCDMFSAVIHENRVDAKTLLLTPNTQTATLWAFLNLKDGPIVVEVPPGVLGLADDLWMRYIVDLGLAGPDKGKGGKYLFLPSGYDGPVPEGYFVARSRTYNVWYGLRGFAVNGDLGPAVKAFKEQFKVYPLARKTNPPAMRFINGSGLYFNTIHSTDFNFFKEINTVIQEEPVEAADPEILGQLAAIGIVKRRPFAPDARMKKILTEAADIGNATARALTFRPRDTAAYFYPGESSWTEPFVGGSHEFIRNNARLLDARTAFFFFASGISPAMAVKIVGGGSQYAMATVDAEGNYLDGGKTYSLHLPPNIPVNNFWSLIPYDTQTRSVLQTDQRDTALTSESGTVQANADGSVDVYFGPKAPVGKESNWIQTVPGKGWFTMLRLYGALESWFDKTWRPGEIKLVVETQSEQVDARKTMGENMSLEDRLAIHEVIARYSYTWDAKDPDGFALLFTEDGVWELVAAGETQPQIRMESRAAIRTMALQDFQGRLAGVTTRHHQTGIVFDALGVDSARTRTMVLVTRQGASDAVPRLSHTGVYDDQWRKTQAGWQFVHRTFRPDRSMSRTTQ